MKIHLVLTKADADIICLKKSLPKGTFNKTVNEILSAEYKGKIAPVPCKFSSTILDCLIKKQIVNHGKRNRYLVSNDHEPIVSRDLYYAVQAEFARRKAKRSTSDSAKTGIGGYSSKYAFPNCTDRIRVLRERREEILRQLNFKEAAKAGIEMIERYLTEDRAVFTEFNDCTVRRLVNSISI